ncbi:hypothetical protein [Marinobacter sp. 2_MG-2023]|uniref:hypothetical protein n=1 Tax=Marinobacter sp. 2_MG-2023 TaxID=3062679 RepID=UPI0026E2469E|nr:hypothetical protein [Marinobacter sp. 2_MG-2023]MDO6442069.1 hypothetical protein [Marinobacter sp. 2_MG-2023]
MTIENFEKAIDTLKLFRRSELSDEQGNNLIEDLYVDLFPNEHLLKTIIKPNTTFLVGRKGTGKSTIFQRAQRELDKKKDVTWAYIDIKSLYESSTSDIANFSNKFSGKSLSIDTLRKINVFKTFLRDITQELKNQIELRIKSSAWESFKDKFSGKKEKVFGELDDFIRSIEEDKFINATAIKETNKESETQGLEKLEAQLKSGASSQNVSMEVLVSLLLEAQEKHSENFSEVYIRLFGIRELIKNLQGILKKLKIKHIYIFIDDFSELPKSEMEEVVDTLLAPFNNWSDEFIKLKVAVYPGRIYTGNIDRSKVDELYLDIHRAFGRSDVSSMEEKSINFTKRLIEKRLDFYCGKSWHDLIDVDNDEIWRTIFHACSANPRIAGYILYYAYEASVIYGDTIKRTTIASAARKYYEDKIAQYFSLNKFLHETFEERSSIFSLKELFEQIVKRAKELRNYDGSKLIRELKGRPPTSHFNISRDYDSVLSSLELNFFLTKYYEMKDRDGQDVSIYALNYGLCQQQSISYGRPNDKREHRLYYVERIFDYNPIIKKYIEFNQEIVCDTCHAKHGLDMLANIKVFNMLCPECKKGQCRIINLSRKYEELIKNVDEENLLPRNDLGILKILSDERRDMFAKEIAQEMDCSYQLVGKRGATLEERHLLQRGENENGRRVFRINANAEEIYFSDNSQELNLDDE